MKKHRIKIVSIFAIAIVIIFMGITSYGHSGRTDANGGHRDNQNKSGLGSYHYHCGGHPAHLHPNGVCPYSSSAASSSSSSNSNKKSSTSSSSSTKKNTNTNTNTNTNAKATQPATVDVEEIKINEGITDFEVGNSKILTVAITPNNATNQNIKWTSSDENIAEVSQTGNAIAKNPGIVTITATSNNGKTSNIQINVKEAKKAENILTNSLTSNSNNTISNNAINSQEEISPIGTILGLGVLGGGGYLGYKKFKK